MCPKRKSGRWGIKVSAGGAGGLPAVQQCIDAKTDNLSQDVSPTGRGRRRPRTAFTEERQRCKEELLCRG
jgi:hypothetical protein